MIAKIKPLPVEYKQGVVGVQNSYALHGWNRNPGTSVGYPPLMGANGRYLTGLDEDATDIKRLMQIDPEEGQRVYNEVKERRERLELATGLDLSAKSSYYNIYSSTAEGKKADKMRLVDKDNIFDFSDPFDEVRYWWAIQNRDLIASSLMDWRSVKCKSSVQFYIENADAEADVVYKKNKSVVDSIKTLTELNLEERKKVAKLCGIQLSESDNEMAVYNKMYEFIMSGTSKIGKYFGQDTVTVFNMISGLSKSVINARFMIEQALELRIYSKRNGVIYEGETMIASTEEQLIEQLASSNRTQEYLALEIKINDKRKIAGGIEGLSYLSAPKLEDVTVNTQRGRPKKETTELS